MVESTTRLIVNADDLGMNQEVNDSIFELIDLGLVTSSTILVNGPAFDDAAARIPDHLNASFGVHLNITQFKPVTDNPDLYPLLDEDGCFHKTWRSVRITNAVATAVLKEWVAQVEKAKAAGIPVSHIDSHHYTHSSRPMLLVLKELQRRLGITRMRSKPNLSSDWRTLTWQLCSVKRLIWRYAVKIGNNTYMPDYLGKLTIVNEWFERQRLPEGCIVEAIVHPAHPRFVEENRMLRNGKKLRLFNECELISFEDIGKQN